MSQGSSATPPTTSPTPQADRPRHTALVAQLRGSSLLLVGRVLSKFVNFGIQVAIVRLLTKDDFGAFAYGLAIVLAGELVVKFGLGRGANRFVPDYAQRGQHAEILGTLALTTAVIGLLGIFSFAALWWISGQGWAGFPTGAGGRVVLILAVLAPVQAMDTICIQTLACFSRPRAIFFRKHVLGPALRAAAVLAVFLAGGETEMLAIAYVAGGVLGLVVCIRLTIKELHRHEVLPLALADWRVPWRPLFRFSLPLLSSDLVFITLTGVTTVLLMTTHGAVGVASMRAVVPAAALNTLVAQSFSILFMPAAMRVRARNDLDELRKHHWQSAGWVTVLSFPIFALTFGVAPDLVPILLGSEYLESASLLALLAVGHYLSACMGFSGQMLQILDRTRAIVWTDFLSIATALCLAIILCPEYGALGAAIAVTAARVLGAVARQAVLLRTAEIGSVSLDQRRIWLKALVATATIFAFGWFWQPPFAAQLVFITLVSILLLRSTARELDLGKSFPELRRIPFLARLAGA